MPDTTPVHGTDHATRQAQPSPSLHAAPPAAVARIEARPEEDPHG